MNASQTRERKISAHRKPVFKAVQEAGIVLSPEQIAEFLGTVEGKGGVDGTVKRYRYNLNLLYADLPPDKEIHRGTLAQWWENLLECGYTYS